MHGYVIGSSFNRKRNILFCSLRASMPQACIHGAEKFFCECFRCFQHEMSTMHCSASVAPRRAAASCAHCYAEWISKVESKPDLGMVGIHSELFAPMPAPYAPWLRLRLTRREFIRAVSRESDYTHPGGCTWWHPHHTPVDAAKWWGLFWQAASSTRAILESTRQPGDVLGKDDAATMLLSMGPVTWHNPSDGAAAMSVMPPG